MPEICVHVDYDTMLNGLHELSLCETADGIPLPPDTVRRLACEAAIVPIVLNTNGEVLDCGREQRVANRAQRRALRAMYRTCGYPGCDISSSGATSTTSSNGSATEPPIWTICLPLCSEHHHLVHEGRWRLTLDKHRVVTIHRPDGTQHFHGTTINRTRRARPGLPSHRGPSSVRRKAMGRSGPTSWCGAQVRIVRRVQRGPGRPER